MSRDRARRGGAVRHLEWRVRLFGVGAILALVGILTETSWLINAAIAVLVVGAALRFAPDRRQPEQDDSTGS